MLTFSFTIIWGCLHTHWVHTVGVETLSLSSCTALPYTVLIQYGSCEQPSHTLKAESQHFDCIVTVLFQIRSAGALSQNNRKCVTVQILTGCTVCAQTCLVAGEAEEGGSDTCMNKRCVREDWLSTLNTWQIIYLVSQSPYKGCFRSLHLKTILMNSFYDVSACFCFIKVALMKCSML